jgi:hypothetical protein
VDWVIDGAEGQRVIALVGLASRCSLIALGALEL